MELSYTKFLNEFQSLETQYYASPRANLQFASLYRSLLHRVEQFNEYNYMTNWRIYYNHLQLQLALICRVINTKNDVKNLSGVELKNRFISIEQRIKQYENAIVDTSIHDYQPSNGSTITVLVVEMIDLLGTSIPSLMDEKYLQIADKIHAISEDIIEQMKRGETNTVELTDKKNELVALLTTEAAVGAMKTTSIYIVYSSLIVMANFMLKRGGTKTITDGLKKIARSNYELERDRIKMQLENPKVNSIRAEYARDVEQFKKTFDKIASFRELLSNKTIEIEAYFTQKFDTKKQLGQYRIELTKSKVELEKQSDAKSAIENINVLLDWLNYVQGAIIAGELEFDSIQKNDNLVSALGNRISEVDDKITQIKEHEYRIRNFARNSIYNKEAENNKAQEYQDLENSKRRMEYIRKEFEVKMKSVFQEQFDFSSKLTLNYHIDKLRTAMTTMLKILDRIQDYNDHATLHKYIEEMCRSQNSLTEADKKVTNDLKFTIKSNLVLLEYKTAVELFKLYIFPYADKYGGHFDISSYLASKNIKALTESAVKEIVNMREIFPASDAPPSTVNITIDLKFLPGEEARKETSNLLKGEAAIIGVDIRRDLYRANVIKFNDIRLRFVLANATLQKEFDEKLADLEVNMVHFGDSHYRCDDQFYISDHDTIQWIHDWIRQNDSRNYMAGIRPVFSPYATWSFQLRRRVGNDPLHLEKFVNEKIYLVLDVRGSYISSNSTVCKSHNLEKYYELDKHSEDNGGQAENHRRKREATPNRSSESIEFASSSAKSLKSPINAAINLLGGVVGYATSYDSIKLGIQSIFGQLNQFNAHGTPKDFDNSPITGSKFGIFESLTLADFFIRWVTKGKPYNNSMEDAMNPDETKAYALNIIEGFEAILKELQEQFDLPTDSLEFDPIALMTDLEKGIINHNFVKIENILLDTVAMNSQSNNSQLYDIAREYSEYYNEHDVCSPATYFRFLNL